MKKSIEFHVIEGETSRQAHADLPANTYERELGREGFFGATTHMYHRNPPTGWSDFTGPLAPRAFDTVKAETTADLPWPENLLLSNASVQMRIWRVASTMEKLLRNSDGDELLFVHEGSGDLFCDYGHLSYRDGDYIVMPRGTMWRLDPQQPTTLVLYEATNNSYRLPDRGMVGQHAQFDPAMLDHPRINDIFRAQQSASQVKNWPVAVKRRNEISEITYPFNPLDATGWKGNLAPVRINWRDIRPLMSHRFHLPPSAHTTFVSDRFVICTFVPRPFESDPGALKVPFFHSNDDFDEVIFYHAGDFFSRDNIHPGMITIHPCGFTHGPHPKALARALTPAKSATEEVAVMLDTRDALDIGPLAKSVEWAGYVNSWKPKE